MSRGCVDACMCRHAVVVVAQGSISMVAKLAKLRESMFSVEFSGSSGLQLCEKCGVRADWRKDGKVFG